MKCCWSITLSNTLCKKVYLVSFDEFSYEDELNIKIDRAIYSSMCKPCRELKNPVIKYIAFSLTIV